MYYDETEDNFIGSVELDCSISRLNRGAELYCISYSVTFDIHQCICIIRRGRVFYTQCSKYDFTHSKLPDVCFHNQIIILLTYCHSGNDAIVLMKINFKTY